MGHKLNIRELCNCLLRAVAHDAFYMLTVGNLHLILHMIPLQPANKANALTY